MIWLIFCPYIRIRLPIKVNLFNWSMRMKYLNGSMKIHQKHCQMPLNRCADWKRMIIPWWYSWSKRSKKEASFLWCCLIQTTKRCFFIYERFHRVRNYKEWKISLNEKVIEWKSHQMKKSSNEKVIKWESHQMRKSSNEKVIGDNQWMRKSAYKRTSESYSSELSSPSPILFTKKALFLKTRE